MMYTGTNLCRKSSRISEAAYTEPSEDRRQTCLCSIIDVRIEGTGKPDGRPAYLVRKESVTSMVRVMHEDLKHKTEGRSIEIAAHRFALSLCVV